MPGLDEHGVTALRTAAEKARLANDQASLVLLTWAASEILALRAKAEEWHKLYTAADQRADSLYDRLDHLTEKETASDRNP